MCVQSTKNFDLRKVKNDNKDAEVIARLAKYQNTSRRSPEWTAKNVNKLQEISCLASSMPSEFSLINTKIKIHLNGIENFQKSLNGLEEQAS